jgi:ElaB/YqjD/DUF883 family membrane-anchored ribosome-binding protein
MESKGLRSESETLSAIGGIEESVLRSVGALGASIAEAGVRGKDAISTVATDATNSAGAELALLRSDLNSLIHTVEKFIAHAGVETEKVARKVSHNMAGRAGDLSDKGVEMASAATDQAKVFASDFEHMVRRNPIGAIAGAVTVGVVIGLLGRRS